MTVFSIDGYRKSFVRHRDTKTNMPSPLERTMSIIPGEMTRQVTNDHKQPQPSTFYDSLKQALGPDNAEIAQSLLEAEDPVNSIEELREHLKELDQADFLTKHFLGVNAKKAQEYHKVLKEKIVGEWLEPADPADPETTDDSENPADPDMSKMVYPWYDPLIDLLGEGNGHIARRLHECGNAKKLKSVAHIRAQVKDLGEQGFIKEYLEGLPQIEAEAYYAVLNRLQLPSPVPKKVVQPDEDTHEQPAEDSEPKTKRCKIAEDCEASNESAAVDLD